MQAEIVLDPRLIEEAMRYTNVSTKRELVELALREFIATRRRRDIAQLFGAVEIDPDYDYKSLRREAG